MARLDYPDLTLPDERTSAVLEQISRGRPFVPNLYRMLLWEPTVTAGWVSMANAVRFDSPLDDRSRELTILMVSNLTGCEYEWHHHVPLANRAGVSEAEVDAVRAWPQAGDWNAADRALLGFVEAMVARTDPGSELEALRREWPESTVVALAATVAYYLGLSHFLLAMGIEIEPDMKEG